MTNESNNIYWLNGKFNIFSKVGSLKALQDQIGKADSVVYQGDAIEEFGYRVAELFYGESLIIVTDSSISDIWIHDRRLNINGVTVGTSIERAQKVFGLTDDSLVISIPLPESTLSFELNNNKINQMTYVLHIY